MQTPSKYLIGDENRAIFRLQRIIPQISPIHFCGGMDGGNINLIYESLLSQIIQ